MVLEITAEEVNIAPEQMLLAVVEVEPELMVNAVVLTAEVVVRAVMVEQV
jgi:hypothetical protein